MPIIAESATLGGGGKNAFLSKLAPASFAVGGGCTTSEDASRFFSSCWRGGGGGSVVSKEVE